jgi:hypothetical protein
MKHRATNERGSALLLALLAMVFLTVVGLALAVVTETEMQIGKNDLVAQETFFAAEAGMATAVSQLLVTNDTSGRFFAIPARRGDAARKAGDSNLGYSVDFTQLYPVAFDKAPYTFSNEGSGQPYYSGFFYTRARARRLAWAGTEIVPDCQTERSRAPSDTPADYFADVQAEKVLTLGFFVSPVDALAGQGLVEGFWKPDRFGCAPERADEEYVQKD